MASIEITCKDPVIERHCREMFGPKFQEKVDSHAPLNSAAMQWLIAKFRQELRIEAARQEWYDFTYDEHGQRVPILDDESFAKLLVPTVDISMY